MTDGRIQNLNGFSIGFFCSHSAHNVTDGPIQNLNGFSIGFFCSHSAHNVTDGPIRDYRPVWGSLRLAPIICLIISMILKRRNKKMSLVQRVMSLYFYGNGVNKQVCDINIGSISSVVYQ